MASRIHRKETLPRVAPLRTSSPSERSPPHHAVAEAESFEVRAATAVHPNSSAQTVRVRDGGENAAWRELVVFPYGESGAFLEVWGSRATQSYHHTLTRLLVWDLARRNQSPSHAQRDRHRDL